MSISSPFVVKNQITVLAPSGDAFPTYVKRIQILYTDQVILLTIKRLPIVRKFRASFFARSLMRGSDLPIPNGIHFSYPCGQSLNLP